MMKKVEHVIIFDTYICSKHNPPWNPTVNKHFKCNKQKSHSKECPYVLAIREKEKKNRNFAI